MPKAQQPVILPDPEMVLPDEQLPPHDELQAVSHLFGGNYTSIGAMIRARSKVEWALNAHLTEEQRNRCVPGSWAYFEVEQDRTHPITNEPYVYTLTVFGEIPDVEDLVKSERTIEIDDTHSRLIRRRIANAHKRGWLFGKWYSTVAPDGAWGAAHISTLVPIERDGFLSAMARKWETT